MHFKSIYQINNELNIQGISSPIGQLFIIDKQ